MKHGVSASDGYQHTGRDVTQCPCGGGDYRPING